MEVTAWAAFQLLSQSLGNYCKLSALDTHRIKLHLDSREVFHCLHPLYEEVRGQGLRQRATLELMRIRCVTQGHFTEVFTLFLPMLGIELGDPLTHGSDAFFFMLTLSPAANLPLFGFVLYHHFQPIVSFSTCQISAKDSMRGSHIFPLHCFAYCLTNIGLLSLSACSVMIQHGMFYPFILTDIYGENLEKG